MMNTIQRGILLLLKSAITGEACQLPEDFSLEDALPIINRHVLDTLVYQGASNCGLDVMSPVMLKLLERYCRRMMRSEAQMAAVGRLLAAFEENGIHHMPLKGTNMKARYPKPELRLMADADILIRAEQYDSIRPILESLGYTLFVETAHEYAWKSRDLDLELHHRLSPFQSHEYITFLGDGWHLAKIRKGFRYAMIPEDAFVFQIAHFAKHYLDGGIGCRHTLDLWVYLRCFPDMDEAYIRDRLAELKLLEFYEHVRCLLKMWFEGGAEDDRTALMTDFIFYGHSWKSWLKHPSFRSDAADRVGSYRQAMDYVGLDYHLGE